MIHTSFVLRVREGGPPVRVYSFACCVAFLFIGRLANILTIGSNNLSGIYCIFMIDLKYD